MDCSAEHIVGGYLADRDRGPLYHLAGSASLWERRMAVMVQRVGERGAGG